MQLERDRAAGRSGPATGWRAWRQRRRHSRLHRILIIVENCSVPRDRRVWKECRSLVEAGFEVSVIAPREPGQPRREVVDGIDLHRYRPTRERRAKLGFLIEFANAWLWTAALSAYVFAREGFAAVQTCNPPDIFFPVALPFKALGCPVVFDQHDLSPELYVARYGEKDGLIFRGLLTLERMTYRVADHVIAVSEPWARTAMTRGRKPAAAVTIVSNGPRLADSVPLARRADLREGKAHLCCWVGAMGAVDDGVDLAIRAIGHLVRDLGRVDSHFAFLGDGEAFEDVTGLTRELGLSEWVTFTGWAEPRLVQEYLSAADIGLQPDPKNPRTDTAIAVKTLEYMAFRVPVVAFDLEQTRRTVGAAGVYADPNDPLSFAKAIDELLADPARREAMGAAGRRLIEESLAWDHQAAKYIDVLRRSLGLDARGGDGAAP
jgi:glycosyltransferase involved in cell wall biosynthesis